MCEVKEIRLLVFVTTASALLNAIGTRQIDSTGLHLMWRAGSPKSGAEAQCHQSELSRGSRKDVSKE